MPPSAAEITGSRPGKRADFLRAQEVGGRRALKGPPPWAACPGIDALLACGDAHSKRATGATCPFGTNGVPIRAVASRPLWIPRRESPCDPARRAGILRGCLRRMPGARYARRPISGLRAAFGGWPPKRGLRTAVAGAPPRVPGLSPLRGPGPAGRNSKRYLREYLASTRRLQPLPTGTPAEGSIQVAGAPNR